ncbi:MAG: Nif3-like dinuclear metal center hexameric protein [Acidimicrobiia bacterium]
MATVASIVQALAERTRPQDAAPWDPVGLQLGNPADQVTRVGVCHEVTESVVQAIEKDPVDLLVTYHPLLFHPVTRLVAGRSPTARAFRLIQARTALLVTHTDFDAAPGGTADSLAVRLRLRDIEPFGADELEDIPPIGRLGVFGESLESLSTRVAETLGSNGLRVSGDRDRILDRVAVVPGSGGEFVEKAGQAADAIVTGDVSHHRTVAALDLDLAVVDPGHIATERPGMTALVALVADVVPELLDLTDYDPETWV